MEPIGKHWIIELYGCDPALLSQPETVQAIMLEAAGAMHATVVTSTFHHFAPHGVSGVVVIKESHLTIHTWPEHGYAAVDIFTCGEMDTQKGLDLLAGKLQAGRNEVRLFERGLVGR